MASSPCIFLKRRQPNTSRSKSPCSEDERVGIVDQGGARGAAAGLRQSSRGREPREISTGDGHSRWSRATFGGTIFIARRPLKPVAIRVIGDDGSADISSWHCSNRKSRLVRLRRRTLGRDLRPRGAGWIG